MSPTHKSQSALEYMMTYGWAILVIVIVAAVLYSLGIFSPASSLSSTVTGFSNLGSVTGECTANGVLRISLGDSTGYPINITSVTAKSSTGQISTFQPNSTVDSSPIIQPTSTYIFSVPNICPAAGSRYSLAVTVNYTEPGQIFPGPYTSTGTVAGTATSTILQPFVASFAAPYNVSTTTSNDNSYMYYTLPASTGLADVGNFTFTITGWVKMPKENGPGNTGQWMADGLFYFGPTPTTGRYAAFIFTPPAPQDVIHTCDNDIHSNSFSVSVFNNSWYFFAASINSTDGLFQLGSTQSVVGDSGNSRYSDGYIAVGASFSCGDFGLIGDLTDLQLYNSSLSAQELMNIYNEGINGGPIISNGLVAFWPLNGTLKDYSGHGFNLVDDGALFTSNYK